MKNINNPLINQLNNIVNKTQLEDVKQIVNAMTNVNTFKAIIVDNPNTDFIYTKIAKFLDDEFNISDFKILETINSIETVQYQTNNAVDGSYKFTKNVNHNTFITILLDNSLLGDFNQVYLEYFLTEVSSILYVQFVLLTLAESSHTDSLTGLKNRLSFQEDMKALIPLVIREKMKIGVLLINIDRFRAVNDEHGTQFGDEFLKLYANTIMETIRTSDVAIRFSGGEFLVLLINVSDDERTDLIANSLKDQLANAYLVSPNGDNFKKTVCIGTAMFPKDGTNIDEVVQKADIALSDARDSGRNKVLAFEEDDGELDLF